MALGCCGMTPADRNHNTCSAAVLMVGAVSEAAGSCLLLLWPLANARHTKVLDPGIGGKGGALLCCSTNS